MRRVRVPLVFQLAFQLEAAWSRVLDRVEGALGIAALSWLTPRELSLLTRDLYARSGLSPGDSLHPWESDWFAQALPREPGRVLLGGAGSGREARHLQRLGHEVFGFDPVLRFVRAAEPNPNISLMRGSYEALVAPRDATERAFCEWIESNAPYDAVLLGWVSFTHLPNASTRRALLERLARLCPGGPILLSFWLRSEGREPPRSRSAVWRVATKVAARLRPEYVPPGPGDLVTHRGFIHLFTEAELEELAAAADLSLDPVGARALVGTCPHVTLRHRSP